MAYTEDPFAEVYDAAELYLSADIRLFAACLDEQKSAAVSNVRQLGLSFVPQGLEGGACTSLFLQKVYGQYKLNRILDANSKETSSDDDDSSDSSASSEPSQKKKTRRAIQHQDMTYADILTHMYEVCRRNDYAQIPMFSSSRPIDIHTSFFEIVPPTCTGTKRALLIGINYPGTPFELTSCHHDCSNVAEFLKRVHGFEDKEITMLLDDEATNVPPTRDNLLTAFSEFSNACQPGDAAFFHFSGHGGLVADEKGDEATGFDQALLPCDYLENGEIIDDEIFCFLLLSLPKGCTLTAVVDCCHSGTIFDLPFEYSGKTLECDFTNIRFPHMDLTEEFKRKKAPQSLPSGLTEKRARQSSSLVIPRHESISESVPEDGTQNRTQIERHQPKRERRKGAWGAFSSLDMAQELAGGVKWWENEDHMGRKVDVAALKNGPPGFPVFIWEHGVMYIGEWTRNRKKKWVREGFGCQYYFGEEKEDVKGQIYIGDFFDGKRHGEGRQSWLENSEIWIQNKWSISKIRTETGRHIPYRYDGPFSSNLKHGIGIVTLKDGTRLKGPWYHGRVENRSLNETLVDTSEEEGKMKPTVKTTKDRRRRQKRSEVPDREQRNRETSSREEDGIGDLLSYLDKSDDHADEVNAKGKEYSSTSGKKEAPIRPVALGGSSHSSSSEETLDLSTTNADKPEQEDTRKDSSIHNIGCEEEGTYNESDTNKLEEKSEAKRASPKKTGLVAARTQLFGKQAEGGLSPFLLEKMNVQGSASNLHGKSTGNKNTETGPPPPMIDSVESGVSHPGTVHQISRTISMKAKTVTTRGRESSPLPESDAHENDSVDGDSTSSYQDETTSASIEISRTVTSTGSDQSATAEYNVTDDRGSVSYSSPISHPMDKESSITNGSSIDDISDSHSDISTERNILSDVNGIVEFPQTRSGKFVTRKDPPNSPVVKRRVYARKGTHTWMQQSDKCQDLSSRPPYEKRNGSLGRFSTIDEAYQLGLQNSWWAECDPNGHAVDLEKAEAPRGYPIFIWKNGSMYVGQWKRDEDGKISPGGFGAFCYCGENEAFKGRLYIGRFQRGLSHGIGRMQWLANSKIWRDNLAPKQSMTKVELPYIYSGSWQDGKKHGFGSVEFKDGTCLRGEWRLGKCVTTISGENVALMDFRAKETRSRRKSLLRAKTSSEPKIEIASEEYPFDEREEMAAWLSHFIPNLPKSKLAKYSVGFLHLQEGGFGFDPQNKSLRSFLTWDDLGFMDEIYRRVFLYNYSGDDKWKQ